MEKERRYNTQYQNDTKGETIFGIEEHVTQIYDHWGYLSGTNGWDQF